MKGTTMKNRKTLALALAAALALGLAGCVAAASGEPAPREQVTSVTQFERIPTWRDAVPMPPALTQHLDPSVEGSNVGLVVRGTEALIQWERAATWQGSERLELIFTQGEQTIVQILPPDATWAHIDGVVPGVGGEWGVVDSAGVEIASGAFSPLALEG